MLSTAKLAELSAELDTLREDRGAVAYALRRESHALASRGTLHLQAVADASGQFRRRVLDLDERLRTLGSESGIPLSAATEVSLPGIETRLRDLRNGLPVRRLLAEAARLRGDLADADWQALRQSASELEAAAEPSAAGHDEPPSLEQHPLSALLRLVNRGAGLSDFEWDRDHSQVKSAFGGGVASAAARGRLALVPVDSNSVIPSERP